MSNGTVSGSEDYYRVAEMIDSLRAHHLRQPGLAELAAPVGLSEAHLQKLFKRWAGISPKRFLQHLTLSRTRRVLTEGGTVLETTHASGLSGAGRLHDLLVFCEAVTPGQAQPGRDLTVFFGFTDTIFGEALIARTGRGLCFLAFRDPDEREEMLAALQQRWPHARLQEDSQGAQQLARQVFSDTARPRLHLRGTKFQIQVWRALLQVPDGQTTTYGRIAAALGRDGAGRAVGTAVGANPISWLIPCHRVLRADGGLGGYRWGTGRKEIMLAWEAFKNETDS